MANPEDDANVQCAPSQADRKASGVHSAKPTVITGSEYSTVNRDPPGKETVKDFDLNYDINHNGGEAARDDM